MKKILILFFTLFLTCFSATYAEKVPLKITPIQIIKTDKDDVQLGDWVDFATVNDVYLNNELYIKKGTPVIAVVDFVHENGWVKDNAEIRFKTFYTTDIKQNKIEINFPFNLTQRLLVKDDVKKLIGLELINTIRGSEVYIEPDTKTFNIFFDR